MPVTMTFVHSIIGKPRFVYRVKPVDAEETASQELIYEAGEVKILNAWDELFLGHVKRAFEL